MTHLTISTFQRCYQQGGFHSEGAQPGLLQGRVRWWMIPRGRALLLRWQVVAGSRWQVVPGQRKGGGDKLVGNCSSTTPASHLGVRQSYGYLNL